MLNKIVVIPQNAVRLRALLYNVQRETNTCNPCLDLSICCNKSLRTWKKVRAGRNSSNKVCVAIWASDSGVKWNILSNWFPFWLSNFYCPIQHSDKTWTLSKVRPWYLYNISNPSFLEICYSTSQSSPRVYHTTSAESKSIYCESTAAFSTSVWTARQGFAYLHLKKALHFAGQRGEDRN